MSKRFVSVALLVAMALMVMANGQCGNSAVGEDIRLVRVRVKPEIADDIGGVLIARAALSGRPDNPFCCGEDCRIVTIMVSVEEYKGLLKKKADGTLACHYVM